MGTLSNVARTQKNLLDVDLRISEVLAELVDTAGISRRELASLTGISANRLGIILRQEPPPATVGEVGQIAGAVGSTASLVIARAEAMTDSNVVVGRFGAGRPAEDERAVAKKKGRDRGGDDGQA